MEEDFKEFVYRYPYGSRPLINFLGDRYVREVERLPEILETRILVNGERVPGEYMLQRGDLVSYRHLRSDEHAIPLPELKVIYEDDDLLAISKPPYLPVSPAGPYYFSALAVYAKEYFKIDKLNPLHRLDLETSGVLVFGKRKSANRAFQPLFAEKKVHKRYQALVFGCPEVGVIEGDMIPLKNSKIHTKQILIEAEEPKSRTLVLDVTPLGDYSLLTLEPITGKTNQLRVHLASVGCPIVGDKKYYPDEEVYIDWYDHKDMSRIIDRVRLVRQALHCRSLGFTHPYSKQEIIIEDPLDVLNLWLKEIHPGENIPN